MNRLRASLVSAALVAAATLALGRVPVEARQELRVVAIGDIHGALDAFQTILRSADLIDAGGRWSGGRAVLVQTGDFTDRGAGVRGVMDLLMALEPQARSASGRLEVVLGNHEVMNLIGDLRDVSPPILASFADAESEKRRVRAFEQYTRLGEERAKMGRPPAGVYQQSREAWMAAHPPGWIEYWEAMGPRGKYGAWLRRKPIFAKVSGTLFMHAGPDPTMSPLPRVEDDDARVRAEIQRFDRFRQRLGQARLGLPFFTLDEVLQVAVAEVKAVSDVLAAAQASGSKPDLEAFDLELVREANEFLKVAEWAVVAENGPLWYRGYAREPEPALDAPVAAMLKVNGVTRFVAAHTPQADGRIGARLGGRVLLIDTGMLAEVYKGRPSALEIRGDQLTAIYPDEQRPITTPQAR